MKRVLTLCGISLLAVMLTASVGQASTSDVQITGNGSLVITGYPPQTITPSTNIAGEWVHVDVDDPVGGGPTTETGSLTRTWNVGWWPDSGFQTTFTANFSVDQDLVTDNVGDWASSSWYLKFELVGQSGTVGVSVQVPLVPIVTTVNDGADFSDLSAQSISLTTPTNQIDGSNYGLLKLTAYGVASAYTVEQQEPPGPDPRIPAPGAILLGSIGAGLVGWLRRRSTL